MSRTLAAGTDKLSASCASLSTTWAVGGWFFITSDVNAARLFHMNTGGTAGAFVRLSGVAGLVEAQQICATTNADSISSTAFTTNTWTFIAATYDEAIDKKVRLYFGTLATDLAEVSYTTQVAGIGTATAWNVFNVGNNSAGTAGLTGSVSRPYLHINDSSTSQQLTVAKMTAVQRGVYGAFYTGLLQFADLSNTTVAQNPCLVATIVGSGGLTATGCTNAEEPPVPFHLPGIG